MIAPEFPGRRESRCCSGRGTFRPGRAIRIAGVDDNSSHLMPRSAEVQARNSNRSSVHAIRCEQAGGACGKIARDETQVEAGFLQPARCCRKAKTLWQRRCGNSPHHAGGALAMSFSTGNEIRSGITVAITVVKRQVLALGQVQQSRSIFSGKACREEAANPCRRKNSGV